jgi:hypothetical protein
MVWPSKRERRSALDEHVRSADRSSQRKAGVRSVRQAAKRCFRTRSPRWSHQTMWRSELLLFRGAYPRCCDGRARFQASSIAVHDHYRMRLASSQLLPLVTSHSDISKLANLRREALQVLGALPASNPIRTALVPLAASAGRVAYLRTGLPSL